MCLGQNTANETLVYDNTEIKNSREEKILVVIIENELRFKSHVKNQCKKASQKIWALSLSSPIMNSILNRRTTCYYFRNLQGL